MKDWQPQMDIYIGLTDKTGEPRGAEDLERLFSALNAVATPFGFSVAHRGTRASCARYFHTTHNADGSLKEDALDG